MKWAEQAACVEDLYSTYEIEAGVAVNGNLTLGENIADLGGVKQSYRAYKSWETRHEAPESMVPGLTNDQLFFVNFAQTWCTVATPEYLRVQVATDPHSPGKFRANVPTSQSPDFAAAFSCAEGTPMNPKDRCEVW